MASSGSEKAQVELSSPLETFNDGKPLPTLFVFDLDYTLWPLWVDTHCSPPLKAQPDGQGVVDRYNEYFAFYPDVPQILQMLREKGIRISIASRTSAPSTARQMLSLLVLNPSGEKAIKFFENMQIFPDNKTTHFKQIQKATGIEYSDMLFFDDESRNRNVEKQLGVYMHLVKTGVSFKAVDDAVKEWRRRQAFAQHFAAKGSKDEAGASRA